MIRKAKSNPPKDREAVMQVVPASSQETTHTPQSKCSQSMTAPIYL